ncbi:restriction endonuclease [Bradyrhizobium sp. A11]|uniref:restriction endonuclease n=1 Tax=Bradyrhizobium sp. A11 TaxID=3133974 RepID=UPI00324E8B8B
MSIPDYQSLMRPLLALASDGREQNINDAIHGIAEQLKLTAEERSQLLPSGKQPIFANRVHWARTYLDKAGAIKRTRRSHFEITERGSKLLAENPTRISVQVLKQFPEFIAFQAPKPSAGVEENEASTPDVSNVDFSESSVTPEEAVQQAETQILESLKGQLLNRIWELSPSFFERLVVDLIVAMGYGGSRANVVQRLGKSGDEGIDGVVNEDPLGLDVVYIQAKRYAADNTIGRERIQQFAGALVGQGASKGVFVTTSSFSRGAIEYALKVPQRIILIDGKELARLMVQYGVGVRIERTVELKRIDLDYFDEGDE